MDRLTESTSDASEPTEPGPQLTSEDVRMSADAESCADEKAASDEDTSDIEGKEFLQVRNYSTTNGMDAAAKSSLPPPRSGDTRPKTHRIGSPAPARAPRDGFLPKTRAQNKKDARQRRYLGKRKLQKPQRPGKDPRAAAAAARKTSNDKTIPLPPESQPGEEGSEAAVGSELETPRVVEVPDIVVELDDDDVVGRGNVVAQDSPNESLNDQSPASDLSLCLRPAENYKLVAGRCREKLRLPR